MKELSGGKRTREQCSLDLMNRKNSASSILEVTVILIKS